MGTFVGLGLIVKIGIWIINIF